MKTTLSPESGQNKIRVARARPAGAPRWARWLALLFLSAASASSAAADELSGEPAQTAPATKTPAPLIPEAPRERGSVEGPHGLALRARWLTVPAWSLAPYLAQKTALDAGWSVALSYLYRRSDFDVVISLDYSWLQASNGNFLGRGNDPSTETHFLVFDGLSSLSADVSLIGHWNMTRWLELRVGGGLGVGGVFGNISQITNSRACTADNAGDPSKCYPKGLGPINDPSDPATLQQLANRPCSDPSRDTADSPCYRAVTTYPLGSARVVPVINAVIGLRFKLYQHVYFNVDGGWRLVGFFLGGGPEFRF